ncbi:MAG: dTDP-4-amino-4,6-dideoxygalactose transaminase [Prevotellaceae bacterium]|jgi:dTDP-4-amino-4,6-dideoxygalactose transaminase|nr:dTDP-4-amino-4,6-dideoxygalactose transaminase [Prevotellaceae bacterium]
MIRFNEAPFLGTEFEYIKDAINNKHISGDGKYTKLCNSLIENYLQSPKVLLTHSCTAALEISALLLDIKDGDEIICPSYTFVTTASSFALRGAKIVFVDIKDDTLNLDENQLDAAITNKTKAVVPVHYAGVSCEMDKILGIAKARSIAVVEDAAQAVGSLYKNKPCGSMGNLGSYSFHETKNISSGEGGALIINDTKYIENAEIIREKGTNRSKFFRGQVDKYTWVELGSSYLPSDMIAAYLYPQLLSMEKINAQRIQIWNKYHEAFKGPAQKGIVTCPYIPETCKHNAHMYYLRFNDLATRTKFIKYMKDNNIMCVFHYVPLHSSPAGQRFGRATGNMSVTDLASNTLVRLPLFHEMDEKMLAFVIEKTMEFLNKL